jgi:hypothetical protein
LFWLFHQQHDDDKEEEDTGVGADAGESTVLKKRDDKKQHDFRRCLLSAVEVIVGL